LGRVDCGGPWLLKRDTYIYSLGKCTGGKFKGSDVVISGGPATANHPDPPSDATEFVKGATAISRSIPTNPAFNATAAMLELMHDGVPAPSGVQTWQHQTHLANEAGGEYLNVQFGWLPLVSDMRNFAHAVKRHSQILNDFKAGSSKLTRVGYTFPSSTHVDAGNSTCFVYRGGNSGVSDSSGCSYYNYQESKSWFNGAFSYHIPASGSQLEKATRFAALADKLLGVKPDPSSIWKASPWTWALDWFTNAGDVMNNISALNQDGLVLKYGYLMSHSVTKEILTVPSGTGFSLTSWSAGQRTRIREFKKRTQANPYGFGVSYSGLSTKQKAIIAAMGLSHSGGHG